MKSALQRRLEERSAKVAELSNALVHGTRKFLQKRASSQESLSFSRIAETIRKVEFVSPVRDLKSFNRSLKTDDPGRIAVAIALHLYGRYKAPAYLLNSWDDLVRPTQAPRYDRGVAPVPAPTSKTREIELYCAWYTVVASGGSLWKEYTRSYKKHVDGGVIDVPMFTKHENHTFLNCPLRNATVREAIIYAIASSYSSNLGIISRICKSKLATLRVPGGNPVELYRVPGGNPVELYTRPFWREVIHFFCENKNSIPLSEMNDLIDYLLHAQQVTPDYSLKGRTLASLRKNARDWHWELSRVKRMGDAKWEPIQIPDESFKLPRDESVTWHMKQIVSSKELAAEGTSMHHCVYSYQRWCIEGSRAIWSLQRSVQKKGWHSTTDRCLTIEMNVETGALVQIRGYANRLPDAEEMAAVRHWASKHCLRLGRN